MCLILSSFFNSTSALIDSATPSQVALAWLLAHSPAMLPIPGTSKVSHLEENLGAVALKLPPSDLATLDRIER